MILGKNGFFVTPSDSLAVITSHMKYIPHFIKHPAKGVARSMPTSTAVDKVAERLELNLYEVPTGMFFFVNYIIYYPAEYIPNYIALEFAREKELGTRILHYRRHKCFFHSHCLMCCSTMLFRIVTFKQR